MESPSSQSSPDKFRSDKESQPERESYPAQDVSGRSVDSAWAQPVSRLRVENVPQGLTDINVRDHQVVNPTHGFGQMWQKTYHVRLSGVKITPAEVMRYWKASFPALQPPGNHFYPSLAGIQPGEILMINALLPVFPDTPGIIPMTSGVMVLYSDDTTFTVMTPQGFPESGWNTFSTFEEDGVTIAQIQSLARASDPVYEFGFRLMGGSGMQEKTWRHVLTSLARQFGVSGSFEMYKTCVDPRVQWNQAKNVWHNAAFRTLGYIIATPFRWIAHLFRPARPS
ncbi:MAG TPA: hypothetical protein VMT46_02240 [Anaerolineaceae bacterium]|nr:hypothetical protein [Anaerolineaceae bacterium]